MTREMKELDRCPYCGGNARYVTEFRGMTPVVYVKCDGCKAKTDEVSSSLYYTAIDIAAEKWNRRI